MWVVVVVVVVHFNWLKERVSVSSPAPPWWEWSPGEIPSQGDRKSEDLQHYSAGGFSGLFCSTGGLQWWDEDKDRYYNFLLFLGRFHLVWRFHPTGYSNETLPNVLQAEVASLLPNPTYVSWLRSQGVDEMWVNSSNTTPLTINCT